MSYPNVPPPQAVPHNVAPMAYPEPVPLPPGAGALVVSVNRGPYKLSKLGTAKLKIDGRHVAIAPTGTWHIPLPPGSHEVRYTDSLGIPIITTNERVMVHPGATTHLSFLFGTWRYQVYDGAGTDVTKYGQWSSLTFLVVFIPTIMIYMIVLSSLGG